MFLLQLRNLYINIASIDEVSLAVRFAFKWSENDPVVIIYEIIEV